MVKTAVRRLTVPLALLLAAAAPAPANPFVQITSLEQARSLGSGQLAAYLHSGNRRVVLRAELAIGRTKQPAGIALLRPFASNGDSAVRALALYGIGLIGTPQAVAPALSGTSDRSDNVRVAALDAVDRLESAHVMNPAQEWAAERSVSSLLHAANATVRARAATTLESFQAGPQARAAERALARSYATEKSGFVRWHDVWSLYRGYASLAQLPLLERATRDRDDVVRIQAVRALGKRGDASALPVLERLLGDPSWRVREQALESITLLHGGTLTAHLKAIPAGVKTPAPKPDPLDALPALPRTPVTGKPEAPAAAGIITQPQLDPESVAAFTGPARGPHPRVRIVTTKGNVYLELYPEWAPLTVENFLNLANRGYYDNNPWFRIVPDFVVQTGDPTGNGNGDAGYSITAEENPIEQDSYVISMGLNYTDPPNAHAERDSAGTQFYITLSPQLHLDRDFTVFGRVIGGAGVLGRLVESDKIVRVDRLADSKS